MKTCIYVCAAVALLLSALPAAAQGLMQTTKVIEATGTGSIFSDDVAGARDRAIDDALRKAVQQALGTYISSEVQVQNYMVVEDNILSWTRGYVRNYSIVSDYKKTPELYEVQLQAEVELGDLRKDADAVKNLIDNMGNPRVMIIMEEQNIGASRDQYHWFEVDMTAAETAIMEKFIGSDFPVVDPSTVRRNIERDQVLAALEGDNTAAAAIGLSMGAEIIVTGKAIARVATGVNLAGMKSCQANVTARVVETDVGRVLATGSKHAAHPHIDEVTGGTLAIEKASAQIADELIGKVLDKWRDKFYNVTEVKLVLRNVESFSQLNDFKNTIKFYLRGVKDIFQRNFAGGTAELDLKLSGNAEQVAREFERRELGKFKVTVTGLSANRITASLAPAGEEAVKQDTVIIR